MKLGKIKYHAVELKTEHQTNASINDTRAAPRVSSRCLAVSFASGNIIASALGIIASLLQARFATPSELGLLKSVTLVMGYVGVLHFGLFDGLTREFPYQIGKGDPKQAHLCASVTQWWALCLSTICALCFALCSIVMTLKGNYPMTFAWGIQSLAAFGLFYGGYLHVTFRTGHDFSQLAIQSVIVSVLSLFLIILIPKFHFYGLCIRMAVVSVIGLLLLHFARPLHIKSTRNWHVLRHLFAIGIPSYAVGHFDAGLWPTIDSTLVLRYLGTHNLGVYSVVLMGVSVLVSLPESVNQVLSPRMAEQYGMTGKVSDIIAIIRKPVALMFMGSIPLVITGWFLSKPVITMILPNYVAAIPALKWACLLMILRALGSPLTIFYILRKQHLLGISVAIGFFTYLCSLHFLLHYNQGLTSFSQALVIGRFTLTVISYFFIYQIKKQEYCSVVY